VKVRYINVKRCIEICREIMIGERRRMIKRLNEGIIGIRKVENIGLRMSRKGASYLSSLLIMLVCS